MTDPVPLPRLYHDLAWLWPHLSPPDHYLAEAERLEALIHKRLGPPPESGPHRILELGAGGGHTLVHLSDLGDGAHHCVAADLSDAMLAHCRSLIPGIETHVGDMRDLRLGQTFDVVLIHDAVDYLLTEDDLSRTFATAGAHLRPGGLLLVAPTYTAETFVDGDVADDTALTSDVEVTYFTFVHDPDPADTTFEMILLYLIRPPESGEPPGPRNVEVIQDRHPCGLFPATTWLRLLTAAGFTAEVVEDEDVDRVDEDPDTAWSLFVGVRSE